MEVDEFLSWEIQQRAAQLLVPARSHVSNGTPSCVASSVRSFEEIPSLEPVNQYGYIVADSVQASEDHFSLLQSMGFMILVACPLFPLKCPLEQQRQHVP